MATEPSGAACVVTRDGVTVGQFDSTPAFFRVEKTRDDIVIACTKPGFQETRCLNSSGYAAAGAANLLTGILTMGVGFAIDSASGADNKYESNVAFRLISEDSPPVDKTLICTDSAAEPVYKEDIDAARAEREAQRDRDD